jgi:hypothetical protein
VCYSCLGSALASIAETYGKPRGPEVARFNPDATKRCFVCDQPAPAAKLSHIAIRFASAANACSKLLKSQSTTGQSLSPW